MNRKISDNFVSKSIREESSANSITKSRTRSAPIVDFKGSEVTIKKQTSAPSYFHSLKENDAPPFRKAGWEPLPKILVDTIFNEKEVIEMVAASDANKDNGLQTFLGRILILKNIIKNHELSEKKFLISLLMETIDYAAQRDFNAFKLAVLMTLYLDSHMYFKWYYWQPPIKVWEYFKENLIRHSIEDSPVGQEVFEPRESYDILSHFHTIYLINLPLIHVLTFGTYKLKFLWPFKHAKN